MKPKSLQLGRLLDSSLAAAAEHGKWAKEGTGEVESVEGSSRGSRQGLVLEEIAGI